MTTKHRTFKFGLVLVILSLLCASSYVRTAYADTKEVEYSTFTGDFPDGGKYETGEQLIGGASWYGFGFLQGNLVRVYIASGSNDGTYGGASTPGTAGYVGIWVDGITEMPQHHLDVWGRIRSTGSAYFAVYQGSVGIKTSNPKADLDVNGSIRATSITVAVITSSGGFNVRSATITAWLSSPYFVKLGSVQVWSTLWSTNGINVAGSTFTSSINVSTIIGLSPITFNTGGAIRLIISDSEIKASQGINAGGSTFSYVSADGRFITDLATPTLANMDQVNSSLTYILTGNATTYSDAEITTIHIGNLNTSTDSLQSQINGISGSSSALSYNLIISTNGSDTNIVSLSADFSYIMEDSYSFISTEAYLSRVGAGGLDTGSESAFTWYKIFLISKGDGNGYGILIASVDVINPVMPADYIKWKAVGTVYNDGSSNLVPSFKKGNRVSYWNPRVVLNNVDPGAGGTRTDLTAFIPPQVIAIRGRMQVHGGNSSRVNVWSRCTSANMGESTDNVAFQIYIGGSTAGDMQLGESYTLEMNGCRSISYTDSGSTATSFWLYVNSYEEAL